MATPLSDFEAARGGGGVTSSSTTVISGSVASSSSRTPVANSFSEDAEEISPILIFLFFHKAVCSELEALHRLALEFATDHHVDLKLLRERYRFLRSIYKHHCNAEDESLSDSTRILFLSCPPVDEAKVRQNQSPYLSEVIRTNELCKAYSDACVELCKELGLQVVDLFSTLQKADDWETICFTDGIHLSAQGSKLVAAEILRVVKEAEWTPSLHWKSLPTEFSEDSPYDLVSADGKQTLNSSEWTYFSEEQWD